MKKVSILYIICILCIVPIVSALQFPFYIGVSPDPWRQQYLTPINDTFLYYGNDGFLYTNQSSFNDSFVNPGESITAQNGTFGNATIGELKVEYAPAECSSNYAMTFFNGSVSICVDDWVDIGGDTITGDILISDSVKLSSASNPTDNYFEVDDGAQSSTWMVGAGEATIDATATAINLKTGEVFFGTTTTSKLTDITGSQLGIDGAQGIIALGTGGGGHKVRFETGAGNYIEILGETIDDGTSMAPNLIINDMGLQITDTSNIIISGTGTNPEFTCSTGTCETGSDDWIGNGEITMAEFLGNHTGERYKIGKYDADFSDFVYASFSYNLTTKAIELRSDPAYSFPDVFWTNMAFISPQIQIGTEVDYVTLNSTGLRFNGGTNLVITDGKYVYQPPTGGTKYGLYANYTTLLDPFYSYKNNSLEGDDTIRFHMAPGRIVANDIDIEKTLGVGGLTTLSGNLDVGANYIHGANGASVNSIQVDNGAAIMNFIAGDQIKFTSVGSTLFTATSMTFDGSFLDLFTDSTTFGRQSNDVTLNFDTSTNDGEMLWNRTGDAFNINDDTLIRGDLTVDGNFYNEMPHMFGLATAVQTVPIVNVWNNITFNDTLGSIQNMTFKYNTTVVISEPGDYAIMFGVSIQDDSPLPSSHTAIRIVVNGTELGGSYKEFDPQKQSRQTWKSITVYADDLQVADELQMQYIASDLDVSLDTHGTYATQPFVASGFITKEHD